MCAARAIDSSIRKAISGANCSCSALPTRLRRWLAVLLSPSKVAAR